MYCSFASISGRNKKLLAEACGPQSSAQRDPVSFRPPPMDTQCTLAALGALEALQWEGRPVLPQAGRRLAKPPLTCIDLLDCCRFLPLCCSKAASLNYDPQTAHERQSSVHVTRRRPTGSWPHSDSIRACLSVCLFVCCCGGEKAGRLESWRNPLLGRRSTWQRTTSSPFVCLSLPFSLSLASR